MPEGVSKGADKAPAPIGFREALAFWLKLGFISFGGPAGQIAILHRELVVRRRWISERRFLHALNYCMVLPGPEAQQLATYIGWLMHRTPGGIVAGALFVLPSLFVLIALSWLYMVHGQTPLVAGVFYGIKPAVTAIVAQAAHRIGGRVLHNGALMAIAALSFLAMFVLHLPFPLIVLVAALAGWAGARVRPGWFAVVGGHGGASRAGQATEAGAAHAPAWIDDHTPTPAHARFTRRGLAQVLLVGAALWLLPMALLMSTWGWRHAATQMAWFFTKAAWLTFGGAYAVLPYVHQGAVLTQGWLTPTQMMDGLALGETTPGPLIMVVAFVGFVGAYAQPWFGPDQALLAGTLGAGLVTWFTFLPSFVLILAGGPLVEATHGQARLTAPLTAITAAVVGVILNLALFFAWHVLWPQGVPGPFDGMALVLALAAGVALIRFQQPVWRVLIICGIAGWAWREWAPQAWQVLA